MFFGLEKNKINNNAGNRINRCTIENLEISAKATNKLASRKSFVRMVLLNFHKKKKLTVIKRQAKISEDTKMPFARKFGQSRKKIKLYKPAIFPYKSADQ